MTIIASIALDFRSPSNSARVSKAHYAVLGLKQVCLLLPNVPLTSKFWIGNKWYSKFWLVSSAGFKMAMELIPVNFFIDCFSKPLKSLLSSLAVNSGYADIENAE